MYCNQCGKKINREDNYCMYCGNQIKLEPTIIHNDKRIKQEETRKDNDIKTKIAEKEYKKPSLDLLNKQNYSTDKNYIKQIQLKLEEFFKENGIEGDLKQYYNSPNFITYAFALKQGTKIELITKKAKDLKLMLESPQVEFEIALNNTSNLGIIIKKKTQNTICLRDVLEEDKNKNDCMNIPFGVDYLNKKYFYDITKLKNILIKGPTGSGKSMLINDIIISILMKATPEEVQLVLVDPKKIELGTYEGIPNLFMPVTTNPKKASLTLKKIIDEIEKRHTIFEESKAKNIEDYNKFITKKNKELLEIERINTLPYIVVIIDEISDIMITSKTEIEDYIMRITQTASVTGIYLIISTSLPDKSIGLIEANCLTKIELNNKKNDLLLDLEGDMIIKNNYEQINDKIQSPFISEEEIQRVINYIVSQQQEEYNPNSYNFSNTSDNIKDKPFYLDDEEYDDPLYKDIEKFVIENQRVSASLFQRKFQIGYNRAARIVDLLEKRGIIGPYNGSKPREVLVKFKKEAE